MPTTWPALCTGVKQANQSGECATVTRGLSQYSATEDKTIGQVPSLTISVIHQQVCFSQQQQSDNGSLWYLYNAVIYEALPHVVSWLCLSQQPCEARKTTLS